MLNKFSVASPGGIRVWFVSLTAVKLPPDLRSFNRKVCRTSQAGWGDERWRVARSPIPKCAVSASARVKQQPASEPSTSGSFPSDVKFFEKLPRFSLPGGNTKMCVGLMCSKKNKKNNNLLNEYYKSGGIFPPILWLSFKMKQLLCCCSDPCVFQGLDLRLKVFCFFLFSIINLYAYLTPAPCWHQTTCFGVIISLSPCSLPVFTSPADWHCGFCAQSGFPSCLIELLVCIICCHTGCVLNL